MKFISKPKLLFTIKLFIPLLIIVLVFYESGSFFKGIDFNLLKAHFAEIGFSKLIIILAFGLASVLPMSFFDVILMKLLGRHFAKKKLLTYSFISNAYSNFLGFGGLTGAALRTYFYKSKEQSRTEIVKGIAKISIFYLSGLSLLSWLVLMGILDAPLIRSYKWLYIGIIAIALYLPVLMISLSINQRRQKEKKIRLKYELQLVLVSCGEWFAALLTMWAIARVIDIDISVLAFAPIYITAACAGVISMIPSGLGSFDLIFLLNMDALNIPKEQVLLLLLLYRLSYNFFPWLVASCLLIGQLWTTLNKKWNHLPEYVIGNISHWIVTILVFISGVILLLSAAFPSALWRFKFLQEVLSTPLINLSHQLSVAMGVTLLALARGIEYRVKWTYYLAMFVLTLGSLFTFTKGFDYEEALFSLAVACLLFMSRRRFYRVNFVPTWGRAIVDVSIILVFVGIYFFVGYLNLPEVHVKIPHVLERYTIQDPAELFRSGFVGLLIACFLLAFGYIVSRPSHFMFNHAGSQSEKIKAHLQKYGGSVLSHLIFLNDKFIFWNKSGDVLLAFQRYADKLVILGDPVGNKDHLIGAIEEFQDEADRFGLTPVYYQVTSDMLPYLHSHGYDFFKLGEEAFVNLHSFTLSGSKMKSLRAINNKFEREGYAFEVLTPPFSGQVLADIKVVSEKWLDGHSEKGFSLGFFDEEYINLTPLAVLKDNGGHIFAFSTIMPMYDFDQTLSVDLMRFLPSAPSGTMDYLFICLFQWGKEKEYKFFNLGMAPLSNVGISKYSFTSEKAASLIYLYGHFLYHFQGLKRFKEKYASAWAPKYLAFRRKSSLPFTMIQLSFLISKKIKKDKGQSGQVAE